VTDLIHCITLNARGLLEKSKRDEIMQWMKRQKADVILLQETHYTSDIISFINCEWQGDAFHSFGTNRSKGVSTLITSKQIPINVTNHYDTNDGRTLLVNVELYGNVFTVVNVYAPNNGRERELFFEKLTKWVGNHQQGPILMGGDFNTVLNAELDRKSSGIQHREKNKTLQVLMQNYTLRDVWREKNTKILQYTWKQYQPLVASRLDMWLIDKTLLSRIKSCDIRPAIRTDHKAVSIKMWLKSDKRGPGTWKLNVSLLDDVGIRNKISHTIAESVTLSKQYNLDAKHTWELCKIRIRDAFINCAKQKQHARNKYTSEPQLQKELDSIDKLLDNGDDSPELLQRYKVLHSRLEEFYEKQARGAQIRSRAAWVEKGERSTKYFFNLENRRQSQKYISEVRSAEGKVLNAQKEVLETINSYYARLYSTCNPSQISIDHYIDSTELEYKLSESERLLCDGILSEQECYAAINAMKINKSPGSDGLPVEFYRAFWPLVGQLVVDSLNKGYTSGCLSASQRHAVISLLYKKNDPQQLDNWRPISLLNTDYKMATTALAKRLQSVIGKIINMDQSGYIEGRFIGHNIRLIQDILGYTKDENHGGAILFLDFRKAFDTVEWPFMFSTLKHFGFGESFIQWVRALYSRTTSCVNNFGWVSEHFNISRGIRQGCPLSALLFIIVSEIMALKIRSNKDIKGIHIKGTDKEIKLTQLADDTTIFVANKASINKCISVIQEFSLVAGPELNLTKSEGLWLGTDRYSQEKPAGLNWPTEPVKALGIYFGYDDQKCNQLNWETKLQKLDQKLNAWKKRSLTLMGRILIVKSFGLSQLIYNAAVLAAPEYVIKRATDIVYKFIWNGKKDKIKRLTLIGDYCEGGLRAPDVQSLFTSLKARWVYRIHNDTGSNWSVLPHRFFNQYGNSLLKMNIVKISSLPGSIPLFYEQVITSWIQCGGCYSKDPKTFSEVRKQLIWGNKFICFRGKPLLYKHWMENGILYINDILDEEHTISPDSVYHKLSNKSNWLAEFYTVLNAIPTAWKKLLQTTQSKQTKVNCNFALKRYDHRKGYVQDPCTARILYEYLTAKKYLRSHMEEVWCVKLNCAHSDYEWRSIWGLTKRIQERKLAMIHYKLLHNILPCKQLLYRWRLVGDPFCNICKVTEDYEHLFVQCKKVQNAWALLCDVLAQIGIENISPGLKYLVFGYKITQIEYTEVNEILSIFAFAVFKSYCMSSNWIQNICTTAILKKELLSRSIFYKTDNRRLCLLKRIGEEMNEQ